MKHPIIAKSALVCSVYFVMSVTSASSQSFGVIRRIDPRANQLIPADAKLEKLAEGFEWTEGPVWVARENCLLFTDIPKNTIYKWKRGEGLSVFLRPSGYVGEDPPGIELGANGLVLDPDGKLVMCDHGNRCLSRLNEQNYEKKLYVANSDPKKALWMAFEVLDDGTIANGKVFFDATAWAKQGGKGLPDGMAVDQFGNLYATGPGGVIIFSPDGKHLGTIETGEATSNCAFGDDGSVLYITADMYLCRMVLNTKGKM